MSAMNGTYSVPISGPSPHLAMLRALYLKALGLARNAWAHTRVMLNAGARLARTLADLALTVLASPTGYRAVTGAVRTATSTVWSLITGGVRLLDRAASTLGRVINGLIGKVSPAAASWLARTTATTLEPVRAILDRINAVVAGIGQLAWHLTQTTLVRRATTLAAQAATLMLAVHAISHGAVAAKIVALVPASLDLVIAATNPMAAIAVVGVVAIGAMGIALARLLTEPDPQTETDAGQTDGPDDQGPEPEEPADDGPAVDHQVDDVITDLQDVARSVRIEVASDGSVIVHGIPTGVPADLGQVVAQLASDAAIAQMRRTLRMRPTPSRDDRRLFTKAAKEAIRAEARRRQQANHQDAA